MLLRVEVLYKKHQACIVRLKKNYVLKWGHGFKKPNTGIYDYGV